MLALIFGISQCSLVHEFQSSCGAIHLHGNCSVKKYAPGRQDLIDALHDYALTLHFSVKQLDNVIVSLASQNDLDVLKLQNLKDGMQRRDNFLQQTEIGKQHLTKFY